MEREELDGVLVQHVHYMYVIVRIATLAKGAPSRAHDDINFGPHHALLSSMDDY